VACNRFSCNALGLFANASEGRSSGDTPSAKAPLSGSGSVKGSYQSPHEIMDDNDDSDACFPASTVAETVTVTPMPAKSAAKRARPSRAKIAVAAANNKKLKVSQAAAVKVTATATPAAKAAEVEAVTVTSSETETVTETDTGTEVVTVTEAEAVSSVPSVTAATVTAAATTLESTDVEAVSTNTADNTATLESSVVSCPGDAAQSMPEVQDQAQAQAQAQGQAQEGEKSEVTEECMADTATVDTDILTVESTTIDVDKKKGEPLTVELERRKRKRPPTNVTAVAAVNAKEGDKPLPPGVVVKIQCHTDRMTATATELIVLERSDYRYIFFLYAMRCCGVVWCGVVCYAVPC
jgi:hypothetical protein